MPNSKPNKSTGKIRKSAKTKLIGINRKNKKMSKIKNKFNYKKGMEKKGIEKKESES